MVADNAVHSVVRWRRIDLSQVIETRYGVHLAERSVGALLARLGFSHVSARPHNPVQNPAQLRHIKNFAALVAASVPDQGRGKPIELWWQDEARVGQQGTLTCVWAQQLRLQAASGRAPALAASIETVNNTVPVRGY